MSSFDRVVGLARSLAIYHAIPGRHRRLRRLYSQFAGQGDLVFDIGAHVGNHVRGCVALGCRVVAIEPQPDFARVLRTLFARSRNVVVLESAVGATEGRGALSISERTPTVTSLAADWRSERTQEPGFEGVRWNRHIEVETTTLDALIARFGVPAFTKIDVEGSEPVVLAGLSHPVPALCFEYLPGALDQVEACLARLRALGPYRFNWSVGESYRLASPAWLDAQTLLESLQATAADQRSGDVFVQLQGA